MELKKKLRNVILYRHPEWYAIRLWLSTILNNHKFTRDSEQEIIYLPKEVMNGPFKGMKYKIDAVWSEKHPKILGTYEKEIHPIINRIFDFKYDQLINIGSAEGFYAVGLAEKINFKEILTVDPLKDSFLQLKNLAADNNVSLPGHLKWLTIKKLNRLLFKKPTLLVLDCEGGEAGYLNSSLVPNLKFADIIVEVHDFLIHDLSKKIISSNALTHKITLIKQEKRNMNDLPPTIASQDLDRNELQKMMDEKRPKNLCWLYMESIHLHAN